jgi:UDP-N-acetylmuramoylalanine--D-glutamate ligase
MDFAGKRVTVMGLGRFGGGVGVARYLVRQGADVLVTDLLEPDKLKDSVAQLDGLPIEFRLGEHNVSDFTTCDLVVANPAVKPDNRFLRAAEAAGIPITSEIRLLVAALPNRRRTIGVTGTAGKSTTTAMIGHILRKTLGEDRVHVGGNLGGSLLDRIDDIGAYDWVVLELSSFMLHGLREDEWSPHIAVVTNISSNHLDWHGSDEAYVDDKRVILDHQDGEEDVAVLGPGLHGWLDHRVRDMRFREERDIESNPRIDLRLPGFHNQINATLACDAAECAGVDWIAAAAAVADFPGLPHRLQFVLEHNGVRYFNDSKCTTPAAAELAIQSFDTGAVHVILGGYDKGSDLTPLAGLAARTCVGLYTIGTTGDGIAAAAEAAPGDAKVVRCGELAEAVQRAVDNAKPGQAVLLSPGCASWDQFDNYEQRGERFIELVRALTG